MSLPPEFVVPEPGGLSGILAASMVAVGLEAREEPSGDNARGAGSFEQDAEGIAFPRVQRACVVLVDGLGWTQLRQRSGHFPFLRNREAQCVTTVAPSTTAAAMTAFGTGRSPGETGMLGYTVRSPQGGLLNLIRWEGGAAAMEEWQSCPTLAQRLARPDRFAVLQPERFAGSGLTVAAFRGSRALVAEDLTERVDGAVHVLRSGDADLAYVYWGEVDHVGHERGWGSFEWGEEASRTDAEIARLSRELPSGTLLVITADHGMVDVVNKIDVATTPALAEGVDLVAGEPRASHLFTSQPEAVAARWREYLGASAWVATREEALPLFGPVSKRFREVVGDVVVFMRGRDVVVDSRTQTPGSIALIGVHGSLTEDEMRIPLIAEVV
ncbi:MAG TPA: alkaline phosphatase family protein [Actinomycetales bacterium]|nr:alkaline phosphatase family protein [Actinomycetales bacterium]